MFVLLAITAGPLVSKAKVLADSTTVGWNKEEQIID